MGNDWCPEMIYDEYHSLRWEFTPADGLTLPPKASPGPMLVRKGFGLTPIFVPEVMRVGQVNGVVPRFAGFFSDVNSGLSFPEITELKFPW